jgi:hypothetical protein
MTNGVIPIGGIIDPSMDRFASTGPHADFRVIPRFGKLKDQKIDPRTARTLLQNVLVGKDQTPLVQQVDDGQWKFNFPVTSEFGPRAAPTAGASTNHPGIDVGIGAGTQLAYRGAGSYTAGDGMGTLSVMDPQGRPYDIQVLHIDPAKNTDGSMQPTPIVPRDPAMDYDLSDIERERDIYQAYAQGLLDSRTGRRKKKSTRESIKERLQRQLVGQILDPLGTSGGFLNSFVMGSPDLARQSAEMQDYFRSFT